VHAALISYFMLCHRNYTQVVLPALVNVHLSLCTVIRLTAHLNLCTRCISSGQTYAHLNVCTRHISTAYC